MELSNNVKKRFCKDFKLPINIFDEPYFSYFTELYNPIFNIEEKIKWLEEAIEKTGGIDNFFLLGNSISNNTKNLIKNSKAYQQFNEVDINKQFPLVEQIQQQNIYIQNNIGKKLISIDLNKANFNVLGLFNLKEEINAFSYDELIKKETDLDYYLNSKIIRQVIFGDLNPARQQRIQKYIINQLCSKLMSAGCVLTSASSDEIIIQNEMSVENVAEILKDVDERFKFFRIEEFKFEQIFTQGNYFIKTTKTNDGDKIEFKNTPSHLFAQVYKKYLKQEINQYDMLFYHEEFLAEFKEPLFKNDIELNNNKKFK